jgi:hypothetical protein
MVADSHDVKKKIWFETKYAKNQETYLGPKKLGSFFASPRVFHHYATFAIFTRPEVVQTFY